MRQGQTLIMVLLVLAVVLTLGLSIASRGVTEVNVSTIEDESSRALDAAEAGVEAALGAIVTPGPAVAVGSSSASYSLSTEISGAGEAVVPAEKVRAGEVVSVFLSGHDANDNLVTDDINAFDRQLNICWGDSGSISQTTPAMEARLYYYASGGGYGVTGLAYDPNGSRIAGNNFASVSGSGSGGPCVAGGRTYAFWVSNLGLHTPGLGMPVGAKPLVLRVKLWYNGDTGHFVGIEATGPGAKNFADQGKTIISSGEAGLTVRKLSVFQRYLDFPGVFDGPVYAGLGGLEKP